MYWALNSQLPRVLGNHIRRGPAAGLRFVGGDTIGYLLGVSEPAVQGALVANLRAGAIFFDVGAHAGFHTILACRLVGPTGHVHAFEPLEANIAVLQANLGSNGMSNATVHRVALADTTGEATMAAGPRHITAALSPAGDTVVQVARADDLQLPPPSLVKIDVEGAETRVLRGMVQILRNHGPTLIIEIHGNERQPVIEPA